MNLAESIRQRQFTRDAEIPLASLIDAYLRDKIAQSEHKGKKTTHSARSGLNRFCDFFRCHPHAIDGKGIREWKAAMLADGLSRASVAGYMRYAQSLCSWAVRENHLLRNPFDGERNLFPQSIPTRRERACDKETRDRLIAECSDLDLKAVLFIGFHAGLRRNEILNIRPDWILRDPATGRPTHFHVQNEADFHIKDSRPKHVPISDPLAAFLMDYGIDHAPYLIRPEIQPGKNCYRWDWKKRWRNYMSQQGVEWVTPHVMRHTWFSLLLSAKSPPPMVRLEAWSGTAASVIQKCYAHLFEDPGWINAAN